MFNLWKHRPKFVGGERKLIKWIHQDLLPPIAGQAGDCVWILETCAWDDGGCWKDLSSWLDACGCWILDTMFWVDSCFWDDSETWND